MSAADPLPTVSFVVKTLNEEAGIGGCLDSVLAAAREIPNRSEIVVADSVSGDRTVEIARRYPARIVQLANPAERGCGAGAQLGYQHASGALVYLLDGDMELCPGFLPAALRRLEEDARIAGVAGVLVDTAVRNAFDRYRVVNRDSSCARRERWLNGGGLYRREAIEACGGYAANRNLKAWEEAELGMRLTAGGWKLERIGIVAVRHTGKSAGTLGLLASRWRSRRAMAGGILLRQALGRPWWSAALRLLAQPLLALATWSALAACTAVWVLSGSSAWLLGLLVAAVISLAAFAIHKRSARHAATSLLLWHYYALSTVIGVLEPTVSPTRRIDSVVLVDGAISRTRMKA